METCSIQVFTRVVQSVRDQRTEEAIELLVSLKDKSHQGEVACAPRSIVDRCNARRNGYSCGETGAEGEDARPKVCMMLMSSESYLECE